MHKITGPLDSVLFSGCDGYFLLPGTKVMTCLKTNLGTDYKCLKAPS